MNQRGLCLPMLALLGLIVVAAGCEQRRVSCAVRSDEFVVKYGEPKVLAGDCTDHKLNIETMGFFTHVADLNPTGKISSVSVRPPQTGEVAQAAATEVEVPDPKNPDETILAPVAKDKVASHKPYALGAFSALVPDAANICTVPTLSPAEAEFDEFVVPGEGDPVDGGTDAGVDGGAPEGGITDGGTPDTGGGTDGRPDGSADAGDAGDARLHSLPPRRHDEGDETWEATHVRYDWSNLRIFVTPGITGSILRADVTYTIFDGPTTEVCKASYKIRAVSPVVSCKDEKTGKGDLSRCKNKGLPGDNTPVTCEAVDLDDPETDYLCVLEDSDIHVPIK